MKKLLSISLSVLVGFVLAVLVLDPRHVAIGGGAEKCAAKNGDVNADGKVDLSDAVTILGHLFLGSPTELVRLCTPPAAPSGLPATAQTACWSFDETQGLWVKVPCGEATCAAVIHHNASIRYATRALATLRCCLVRPNCMLAS